jgi:hypothetical protein
LELSIVTPLIIFLSSTPINKTPPEAFAKAHTSSVILFRLVGKLTLNSALNPSPELIMLK